MGAGSSKPPPPPRVSVKLAGTTVQLQHLPPLITAAARDGLQQAAEAKAAYLARDAGGSDDGTGSVSTQLGAAHDRLAQLVAAAHAAGNFRDYLALLVEKAVLGLSTRSGGGPSAPLLEIARLVNPFLNRRDRETAGIPALPPSPSPAQPSGSGAGAGLDSLRFAGAFRPADLDHVAAEERDLLVLLYYCRSAVDCADEAVDFVARVAEKGATPDMLERRKESFTETEIYVHWASCYVTTYLAGKPPGMKLSESGAGKLRAESGQNLARVLTICEMLLREHRLDQVCLLLQFVDAVPAPEAQAWYAPRVRSLAKEMRRKKGADRALRDWHVERADRLVRDLKRARDTGRDRWGRKGGAKVVVGDGVYELHKMKKD